MNRHRLVSRQPYNSPEHTPSSHSTSLLTVVKFSYPFSVMVITSSILMPPTFSYLARTP